MKHPASLSRSQARQIWLRAQRLDTPAPFGEGPAATTAAVEHLGYVQIDTINVIERCHHHILFTRIPGYKRADLRRAQSLDKTVFEYWTHALAYVPVRDFRFFVPEMLKHRKEPHRWPSASGEAEYRRVLRLIRDQGPLTIRDFVDDVLVEKEHLWASRKPSKPALELGFYNGVLVISERTGMLKTYELATRHFGWDRLPRPATERQVHDYVLDRALTAQGIVSLDSALHMTHAAIRPALRQLIEARVKRRQLVPLALEGAERITHWARPEALELPIGHGDAPVHILSPFDPLIIQRKRLSLFFGYDHVFEAYVPKTKRQLGYFALPELVGDRIVAALDLKTDRAAGKLLIQKWTWVGEGNAAGHKAAIDEALGRFERFQLGD